MIDKLDALGNFEKLVSPQRKDDSLSLDSVNDDLEKVGSVNTLKKTDYERSTEMKLIRDFNDIVKDS